MGLYAFSRAVGALERELDNWPICEQPSNLQYAHRTIFIFTVQILHDKLFEKFFCFIYRDCMWILQDKSVHTYLLLFCYSLYHFLDL